MVQERYEKLVLGLRGLRALDAAHEKQDRPWGELGTGEPGTWNFMEIESAVDVMGPMGRCVRNIGV